MMCLFRRKTKTEESHPLPAGLHVLSVKKADPKKVDEMFVKLEDAVTPDQARIVRKARQNYAEKHK